MSINLHTEGDQNPEKFIIVKIDDFGSGSYVNNWQYVIDLFMNKTTITSIGLKADFGIIGNKVRNTNFEYIIQSLINSENFDIYNHGWFHDPHDYSANQSYNDIYESINNFDGYLNDIFNYKTKILGAPANDFDRYDYHDEFYQVLAEFDYKVAYFSGAEGDTNDGSAGLNMIYCPIETFSPSFAIFNFDSLINCVNNEINDLVIMQLHPANLLWNTSALETLLTKIYKETSRSYIRTWDYYMNYFLVDHPNYFLKDKQRFCEEAISCNSVSSRIFTDPLNSNEVSPYSISLYPSLISIIIFKHSRKKNGKIKN